MENEGKKGSEFRIALSREKASSLCVLCVCLCVLSVCVLFFMCCSLCEFSVCSLFVFFSLCQTMRN